MVADTFGCVGLCVPLQTDPTTGKTFYFNHVRLTQRPDIRLLKYVGEVSDTSCVRLVDTDITEEFLDSSAPTSACNTDAETCAKVGLNGWPGKMRRWCPAGVH